MTVEEIRERAQGAWDQFYCWQNIWRRSRVVSGLKGRIAFMLISKLYRQMYANTGIATDSARVGRSAVLARFIGAVCRRLFIAKPLPELQMPTSQSPESVA
jgi:hypothetical protein